MKGNIAFLRKSVFLALFFVMFINYTKRSPDLIAASSYVRCGESQEI
jgi:hypothetical protein